jgi:SAM-dependent methyltransferase
MTLNALEWNWKNADCARVPAVLEFGRFFKENPQEFNKSLIFNGANDPELSFLKSKTLTHYSYYNDRNSLDLHTMNLEEKSFDFFMTNQTLEHTLNPFAVVHNVYKHLAEGGIAYMNLPAVNIPHSTPFHQFTGFTPVGLGCIFKSVGFNILDIGFWGNRDYHQRLFQRQKECWPTFKELSHFKNEPDRPVVTWIFAQK